MSYARRFRGPSTRLILSFDIGTTYSGVSYAILDPGAVPKICSVTRYPGQEHASGSPKIPSIIYYDQSGTLRAAGAEAQLDRVIDIAEEEGWMKVEWFKLRMRPKSMPMKLQTSVLPPLPPNKSVTQVFADMLSYLMNCAEKFIQDSHPTISRNWSSLLQNATFVIAHPNGWEGAQQSKMKRAAVIAGLVPNTLEGKARVVFVTEGEASLHFCVKGGFVDESQRGFIVADLGGGTLDLSAYRVKGVVPLRVEESAPVKCDLEGSTFVTQRAKIYLTTKLASSKYCSEEVVQQIADRFDETVKRTFQRAADVCLIPFGAALDKDPEHDIRSGKLRLSGEEVARFFEPSVASVVESVKALIQESWVDISAIYMVGGFSASPYLVDQLIERLRSPHIVVTRPEEQTSKAVANGAISFYIDHYVNARVVKVSYGVKGSRRFVPDDRQHVRRSQNIWARPSGEMMVSGAFFTVVEKGTAVSEEKEFREEFSTELEQNPNSPSESSTEFAITAYTGPGRPPEWIDEVGADKFRKMFSVSMDLKAMKNVAVLKTAENGKSYRRYDYELAIFYGGPEVKAQLIWNDKGHERRGPAQIVYEGAYDGDAEDEDEDRGASPTSQPTSPTLPALMRFSRMKLGH